MASRIPVRWIRAACIAIGTCLAFPGAHAQAHESAEAGAGTEGRLVDLQQTTRLIQLAQPKLRDAAGWAGDILWALEFSGLGPNAANVCALIATIDQESNFKANPPVEGMGRRAIAAMKAKLEGVDFQAIVLRGLFTVDPGIKRRLFVRLGSARTERDIDLAYRKLIEETLTIESIIDLDRNYGLGAAEFFEARNEVTTIGSMQVSVASALAFERRYLGRPLYFEDIYRVRDYLYTRRGGILAGTRQLLGYRSGYSNKIHRFADFNAGRYSSRNAAFQWAVSRLGSVKLDLDGDLLIYRGQEASNAVSRTESALRKLNQTHRLGLGARDIRRDLGLEKRYGFIETDTYARITALYRTRFGEEPPFARLPEIRLESIKLDRALTTAWFAKRVEHRYRLCLRRLVS